MSSCLITPRWTKLQSWDLDLHTCSRTNIQAWRLWLTLQSPPVKPGPRAGFQLSVPVQTGFSEWSFWSVCSGTAGIPRHRNQFHQCFLNVENHCYLLILIYTNGSVNQMLIKTLCSVWWWNRQSALMVTILFIYGLPSSLEGIGERLKLARGHSPPFYRWRMRALAGL